MFRFFCYLAIFSVAFAFLPTYGGIVDDTGVFFSGRSLFSRGLYSGMLGNGLYGGLYGNGLYGNGLYNGLYGNSLYGNGFYGNELYNGLYGNGLYGNGLYGGIYGLGGGLRRYGKVIHVSIFISIKKS